MSPRRVDDLSLRGVAARELLRSDQILHDQVYLIMRQALVDGVYRPGEILSIRALAGRFGTSLIPVRDALKRLVAERALALRPDRMISVPLLTRERFLDLLAVRLLLEAELARRAATLIDETGVRALEQLDAEMRQGAAAGDVTRYLASNYAFHHRLYAAAGSPVMLPIVETLWVQAGPFLNGVFTEPGTAAARNHHAGILRALRDGDADRVAEAIRLDLREAAEFVLTSGLFAMPAGDSGRSPGPGGGPGERLRPSGASAGS